MIDWYDKNQCHDKDSNGHDRTNGRIFKVSFGEPKHVAVNLAGELSRTLVALQTSPNEWHARHARRVLQERGPNAEAAKLLVDLREKNRDNTPIALRALLAQRAVGGLSDPTAIEHALADPDPVIRAWTIQLATEQGPPPAPILARFTDLAQKRPVADGPSLPGFGAPASAARKAVGYR